MLPEAAAHSSRQKSSHHRKVFCPRDSLNQDVGRMRIAGWCCRGKRTRPSTRTWVELVGVGVFRDGKGVGWTSSVPTLAEDARVRGTRTGLYEIFHTLVICLEINRLDGNRNAFPFPLFFPGPFFLPFFFFFFFFGKSAGLPSSSFMDVSSLRREEESFGGNFFLFPSPFFMERKEKKRRELLMKIEHY